MRTRIALFYEGTNHIQDLDLVGRKFRRTTAGCIAHLRPRLAAFSRSTARNPALKEFTEPLAKTLETAEWHDHGAGMKDGRPRGSAAVASKLFEFVRADCDAWDVVPFGQGQSRERRRVSPHEIKTARYYFSECAARDADLGGLHQAGKAR